MITFCLPQVSKRMSRHKNFRQYAYTYEDVAYVLRTTVSTAKKYGQGERRQFNPTDIRSVFRLALQRQRELDMQKMINALCQMMREQT